MSAASLATSVPLIPIEIPISAFFKAGASLTPSPTIAVIFCRFWSASIISSLFCGVVRAKTWLFKAASSRSLAESLSHSAPVIALIGPVDNPSCLPIARAVCGSSPVIILTETPARFICFNATITSSRGASWRAAKPSK